MILDRANKIGFFEYSPYGNTEGLLQINFQTNERQLLTSYLKYNPLAISPDGRFVCLNSEWLIVKGTNKTELVVLNIATQKVVYSTQAYLVHDAVLSWDGACLLIQASAKKPFCLNIADGTTLFEMTSKSVSFYQGTFNRANNSFMVPHPNKARSYFECSFPDLTEHFHLVGVKTRLTRLRYAQATQLLYYTTEDNELGCLDTANRVVWRNDFKKLGIKDGRINASSLYLSEDEKLLCLPISDSQHNAFGLEYVISAETGEIIHTIEGFQYRGRISCDYFGNSLLTFTGHKIDLLSGVITKNEIY
jgi:hypothetical protein